MLRSYRSTRLNLSLLALTTVAAVAACAEESSSAWSVEDKAEAAQQSLGKADGVDICAAWDWYDDDFCDDPYGWCASPDPDCGADGDTCPQGMTWSGESFEGCQAQQAEQVVASFTDPVVIGQRLSGSTDSRAYASVALDNDDQVHVTYVDWGRRPVYTTPNDGWSPHPLASLSVREGLAIAADTHVHLVLADGAYKGRHVILQGFDVVSNEIVTARARSIGFALDQDTVHIVFGAGDNNPSLSSTIGTLGMMSNQTVVNRPNITEAPEAPSVALDLAGNLHSLYGTRPAAYNVSGRAQARYAHRDGAGIWTDELIGAATFAGGAIAVDGAGNPYATYLAFVDGAQTLMFAEKLDGTWRTAPLFAAGVPGRSASIVAQGDGTLHLVYRGQGVNYVSRDPGGAWSEPVLLDANASMANVDRIGLAVATSGAVHVVYSDIVTREVRYLMRP